MKEQHNALIATAPRVADGHNEPRESSVAQDHIYFEKSEYPQSQRNSGGMSNMKSDPSVSMTIDELEVNFTSNSLTGLVLSRAEALGHDHVLAELHELLDEAEADAAEPTDGRIKTILKDRVLVLENCMDALENRLADYLGSHIRVRAWINRIGSRVRLEDVIAVGGKRVARHIPIPARTWGRGLHDGQFIEFEADVTRRGDGEVVLSRPSRVLVYKNVLQFKAA